VHVHRLVPITRKKEEAIRTALQNSRTHELLSQVFRNGPNEQRATRMIRLTFGAHPRPLSFHAAAGCSALLGRGRDCAESQPLDTSEFAKIAVESAEGQVTRFPSNLQNQAV